MESKVSSELLAGLRNRTIYLLEAPPLGSPQGCLTAPFNQLLTPLRAGKLVDKGTGNHAITALTRAPNRGLIWNKCVASEGHGKMCSICGNLICPVVGIAWEWSVLGRGLLDREDPGGLLRASGHVLDGKSGWCWPLWCLGVYSL